MPIKPVNSPSGFSDENSELTNSSFANEAKDAASSPHVNQTAEMSEEPPQDDHQGMEVDAIDTSLQYELDLFLQPDSAADFEYWARVPVWSLDEAIALSFGRDPDQVDWDLIEIYRDVSSIARGFWNCRQIIIRYQSIGRVSDPGQPPRSGPS